MNIADLFFTVRPEGFEKLNTGIDNAMGRMDLMGRTLTNKVTKPIVGMATNIIETTMTFDKQMSRVAAVTGATGKDFETMRKLAIKMGSDTSKTATESAEAIEYMGLAGWNLKQIQEGLEPVLRASEAGVMDLGETSDLVTDSMAALGIETKDLDRYLNIAAKAQNTTNQSMKQFLEAMVTAGGSFKMFNMSLEESGALLGILANRGIKGSEAGNALISIFSNLTSGTGRAGKAMKELGINVYDSAGNFIGMSPILQQINAKFTKLTEAQKQTYTQMLGGKTRTKELNALLSGTALELKDVEAKLYDSDGALSSMAKTMQDNFAGQVTKLKSKLEGIAIALGDRLTPWLEKAANWVQKLADWFYKLDNNTKDTIMIIAGIAAAIGPLLLGITGLTTAFSMMFTPMSLIIAVIGGLAYKFIDLMRTNESFRNNVIDVFINVKNIIVDFVNNAQVVLGNLWDYISTNIIPILVDIGQAIITNVVPIFQTLWQIITDLIIPVFQTMWTYISNYIIPIFVKIWDFIKVNILPVLLDFWTFLQNKIIPILASLWDKISTYILPIFWEFYDAINNFVLDVLFDLWKQIKEKVLPVLSNLWDGVEKHLLPILEQLWKKVEDYLVPALSGIWDVVKKYVLPIFKELFSYLSATLIPILNVAIDSIEKLLQLADWWTGSSKLKEMQNTAKRMSEQAKIAKTSLTTYNVPDYIYGHAKGTTSFSGGLTAVGEQGFELLDLPKGTRIYSNTQSKNMLNRKNQSGSDLNQIVNNFESVTFKVDISEIEDLVTFDKLGKYITKGLNKN